MYVLKALTEMSDAQIFEHMTTLRPGDTYWKSCVKNMLIAANEEGVHNKQTALVLLGARFRVALRDKVAPWEPDEVSIEFNNCAIMMSIAGCWRLCHEQLRLHSLRH